MHCKDKNNQGFQFSTYSFIPFQPPLPPINSAEWSYDWKVMQRCNNGREIMVQHRLETRASSTGFLFADTV
jgi:hypothetical protein